MIELRGVGQILGGVVCSVGVMMLVPAALDLAYDNPDWSSFVLGAAITGFAGGLMVLSTRSDRPPKLNYRQAFVLIAFGWIFVAFFGAIPLMEIGLTFTDAVFETMSGLTTTGSTVLTGLDGLPPGILLWRAILQWIGGIGIIAVAVMILPILRVGGMQLFKLETSRNESDSNAFTTRTLAMLLIVYCGLTALCMIVYFMLGMRPLDAVAHGLTTLSTGGFSTHDASFGYFQDARLYWAATLFMICGAIPFVLFVRAIGGDLTGLFRDQQVRGFIAFLILASLAMTLWLMGNRDFTLGEALTQSAFHITSVVTTTGFAADDYMLWGHGAISMFLVLMFVGGCSGSTSGSIKIYRYQVLWIFVRAHVRRLFSPSRVIALRYNGSAMSEDVPLSVLAFLAVFMATITIFTLALGFLGIDMVTAYSACLTSIANVGPGLGDVIGPSGTFQTFPDSAKWLLVCAMLAGRLEVIALLVFFEKDFWTG